MGDRRAPSHQGGLAMSLGLAPPFSPMGAVIHTQIVAIDAELARRLADSRLALTNRFRGQAIEAGRLWCRRNLPATVKGCSRTPVRYSPARPAPLATSTPTRMTPARCPSCPG
jgi:hypothetical protein